MDTIQQEVMLLAVYWNGNQPYLAQWQMEAIGYGHLIKPNMPGGYQPFTMGEIEQMVANYNSSSQYTCLQTTDMEYPRELAATAPVNAQPKELDPMTRGALDTVTRAGFG